MAFEVEFSKRLDLFGAEIFAALNDKKVALPSRVTVGTRDGQLRARERPTRSFPSLSTSPPQYPLFRCSYRLRSRRIHAASQESSGCSR